MKLKSKLIATIVSICAAIAVMGVGVWAASSSFTVAVENTVSLAFQNLDGTVTVSASVDADAIGTDATKPAAISGIVLYDGTSALLSKIDKDTAHTNDGDEDPVPTYDFEHITDFITTYNKPAQGDATGFLTQETTKAYVMYDFKYTPSNATGVGSVYASISNQTFTGLNTKESSPAVYVTYYARAYAKTETTPDTNVGWKEIAVNEDFIADDNQIIEVKAVLRYVNPNKVSVAFSSAWKYSVNFAAQVKTDATENGTIKLVTDSGAVDERPLG